MSRSGTHIGTNLPLSVGQFTERLIAVLARSTGTNKFSFLFITTAVSSNESLFTYLTEDTFLLRRRKRVISS